MFAIGTAYICPDTQHIGARATGRAIATTGANNSARTAFASAQTKAYRQGATKGPLVAIAVCAGNAPQHPAAGCRQSSGSSTSFGGPKCPEPGSTVRPGPARIAGNVRVGIG